MEDKYDLLVFVGRFQPVHNGHVAVMRTALAKAKHLLILVGSANLSRSTHNPFNYQEREAMIKLALGMDKWEDKPRVAIAPLDDVYDDDEWVLQVQEAAWKQVGYNPNAKIGLIGREKDGSSYYLRLFPQWGSVDVQNEEYATLNATDIRKVLFTLREADNKDILQEYLLGALDTQDRPDVPPAVGGRIMQFWLSPTYRELIEEDAFCEKYKTDHMLGSLDLQTGQMSPSPHLVTFNTVDAVCVQSGQVLLVTRKDHPGKNKLALPGGFIKHDERLLNSCLRELKEETKIDLPPAVLRSSVKGHKIFDAPHRDPRGRFITTAFLFDLPKSPKLPTVKGSDDAKHAAWYDVSRLQTEDLFIDHHNIIKSMMRML